MFHNATLFMAVQSIYWRCFCFIRAKRADNLYETHLIQRHSFKNV
jgi:hypothetical protein